MERLEGRPATQPGGRQQFSLNEVGMTCCICTQVRKFRATSPLIGRVGSTTNVTESSCPLHHPNLVKTHQNCPFDSISILRYFLYFLHFPTHEAKKKTPKSSLPQSQSLSQNRCPGKPRLTRTEKGASKTAPLILDLLLNFLLDLVLNFHNPGPEPLTV